MSSVPPEQEGSGADAPKPQPSANDPWSNSAVGNQPPSQPAPQAPYGQHPQPGQPPQYGRQPGQPQTPYGQTPTYGQAPQGQIPQGQAPQGGWRPGQPGQPQPGQYPGAPGAQASYGQASYGQPAGGPQANYGGQQPGYPQGAYGAPHPGQPYPSYGATPATGQASKPNMKLIAIIGGALLALLLIGALLASMLGNKPAPTPAPTHNSTTDAAPATSADPSPSASGAPAGTGAATADDAVKGYMEAIAAGDSAKALSFTSGTPSDPTLLTDAVLAVSKQKHPITNITVAEGESKYDRVATFTVDGKQYTQGFLVSSAGSDKFTVKQPAVDVSMSSMPAKAVGLTVNGVTVKDQKMELFPGVYDLGTSNANFATTSPTLAVASKYDTMSTDITAKVSDAGEKAVRQAAKDQLTKCQSVKALQDDTCGFNFNSSTLSGDTVDPKTMSCTPSGQNSIDTAQLRPDYTDPRQVTGNISIKWSCTLKSKSGDPLTGGTSLFRFKADMSQNPIKVTFQ